MVDFDKIEKKDGFKFKIKGQDYVLPIVPFFIHVEENRIAEKHRQTRLLLGEAEILQKKLEDFKISEEEYTEKMKPILDDMENAKMSVIDLYQSRLNELEVLFDVNGYKFDKKFWTKKVDNNTITAIVIGAMNYMANKNSTGKNKKKG